MILTSHFISRGEMLPQRGPVVLVSNFRSRIISSSVFICVHLWLIFSSAL
jgi:hypothetical protein